MSFPVTFYLIRHFAPDSLSKTIVARVEDALREFPRTVK